MTTRFRLFVGSVALATGLWFLTTAVAAPVLPAETYKKAVEADIAQLQKHIATCQEDPKEAKRFGPTAKSLAMMLAMYGEATGDAALKDNALKVADAIKGKDYKGAATLAKGLAVKGGGKALAPGMLHAKAGYSLDEVMSPFRGSKVGGLNMEKDIRDMMNGKKDIEPAAIQVLAARTAILGEYSINFPNDKATVNDANKKEWTKWSQDMTTLSQKLAEEAGKKSPNNAEITKMLKSLDAKCSDCHNKYRD